MSTVASEVDDLEGERRRRNLALACGLSFTAIFLFYPLALLYGTTFGSLLLVHAITASGLVLARYHWSRTGAWVTAVGVGLVILAVHADVPEIRPTIYYVVLPVMFVGATLSASEVAAFTGLMASGVIGLWLYRGAALDAEMLRLLNIAVMVLIGGSAGGVAAWSSERLVRRVLNARDAELEAERRAAHEESLRMQAELATARSVARDEAKSTFLASMSHELRTPLNAIIGYAELVREELDDDGLQEDLGRIASSGQHLRRLIDDVLDLSKIEAGRFEVRDEDVGLAEVFDEVATTARPLVLKRGNTLEIADGHGLVARADRVRVVQVLLNLVGNAAKFTESGRVSVEVEAVTAEQLESAFEAFSQVGGEAVETRTEGGTGLGLPLARRLTEAMGGTLTATSTPGVGTAMRVTLRTAP
ncbi:MAG: HAMP domain-containing histidine kinase [Alphaproteobacteria bacterium]|nr:HAMP domain-containing histidine kinase [Alphaproteobacteria bacterium]